MNYTGIPLGNCLCNLLTTSQTDLKASLRQFDTNTNFHFCRIKSMQLDFQGAH